MGGALLYPACQSKLDLPLNEAAVVISGSFFFIFFFFLLITSHIVDDTQATA